MWICPWPNGHIQAIGTDAAGRRQYRYHDVWRQERDNEKFAHVLEFATALPGVRRVVGRDLRQPGLPKTRVLALGVRLLEIGMFRVGGEQYAEAHQTYGLATLQKRHVFIHVDKAIFDYSAKGSKQRLLTITDPLAIDIISQLKRRRGGGEEELLAWQDGKRWVDVRSHDLNGYLKETSGGAFTAKDFRTWDASLLAAVLCAQAEIADSKVTRSIGSRGRRVVAIVREVAAAIGDTPAVCRRSYIDPRIIDRYECGETIAKTVVSLPEKIDLSDINSIRVLERAVIALIGDDTHRKSAVA